MYGIAFRLNQGFLVREATELSTLKELVFPTKVDILISDIERVLPGGTSIRSMKNNFPFRHLLRTIQLRRDYVFPRKVPASIPFQYSEGNNLPSSALSRSRVTHTASFKRTSDLLSVSE
ncbi:hypothetical protein AVEN_98180-1 [Araneus ventricosus]|uniref:Uncharacterized protein n=1 Tax=Araneus ventricosus TaxID=182803 RepID=A0A4Y2GSH4_ARAVE|nr:hypothetical protein AVEN_98180-1 [Araneus ventricosus]